MKKPRILLIGKNGQVGFEALRALAALGELIAVDRSKCGLRFASSIRQQIEETHPQVIVNAAAYTAVDRAESDRDTACAVNASALELIGQCARAIDAMVFQYSTDYVFDGAKPEPYVETDPVAPMSVYGASKLDGKRLLAASGCRHIIFRTSWVFGAYGTNFLKTMLKLGSGRDNLRIVGDQRGVPTLADLIVDVTAHTLRQVWQHGTSNGIYHLAPSGETTWYEYAQFAFAEARRLGFPLKVSEGSVVRISTPEYPTPAKRPANSRFLTVRLQEAFNLRMPDWREGVVRALRLLLRR